MDRYKRRRLEESRKQLDKKLRRKWELRKKLWNKWKFPPKLKKPNPYTGYPPKNF